MIETQSMAPTMSKPAQDALATMFAGLAAHFRALARGRVAPLGDGLLQKIDIAIGEVAACTAATHACIAAVVGLRQTLDPDAPSYQPRQTGEADAAQAGPSEAAGAFSSEVGTGSREQNASKQKARASVPIQSERRL
jgi:hypothetical protein